MSYEDAIAWLKENNYKKEDGTFYEIGEDIPEVGIIVAPSQGWKHCFRWKYNHHGLEIQSFRMIYIIT